MKKMLITMSGIFALAQLSFGQKSFSSGSFILGFNAGVNGNTTRENYVINPEASAKTFNGSAPASDLDLTAEYGLLGFLGIGAICRFDQYMEDANEVTQSPAESNAVDIGATANLHFIRWRYLDVFAGYDYGFSHLTYTSYNGYNTISSASGTWSDVHATGRLYFGRLGLNLNLYIPNLMYSGFTTTNVPPGEYVLNDWKATGYGASVGVQYRL
jgi:hypothetical protein